MNAKNWFETPSLNLERIYAYFSIILDNDVRSEIF